MSIRKANYQIILKDNLGEKIGILTDYIDLVYTKNLNDLGFFTFVVLLDNPLLESIENYSQIEIRRRVKGALDWYRDFTGFVIDVSYETPQNTTYVTVRGFDQNALLKNRVNAYKSGISNVSQFNNVNADVIAETIVKLNLTTDETGDRLITGTYPIYDVTVTTSGLSAASLNWSNSMRNLLDSLLDLCNTAAIDFEFAETGQNEFTFSVSDLFGEDKRNAAIFSLKRGNMQNIKYDVDRMQEIGAVLIGGRGEGIGRYFEIVEADPTADFHVNEVFFNGSGYEDSFLSVIGQREIAKAGQKEFLDFYPVQQPNFVYGREFDLGDLVYVDYFGATGDYKITKVAVKSSRQNPDEVQVEVKRYEE